MAVAYDSGGKTTTNYTGTTKSTSSFTIANTANRVLFTMIAISAGDFVSTVKWNTTESLTLGIKLQNTGAEWLYLYYLVNPTATTSTVDVVASSNAVNGVILATAYNGAGTPTQFSSNNYTGASITETLTISSGSWIIGGAGAQRLVSAGSGTTLRQQDSANNNTGFGDSGGAPGSGSQSIIWTHSSTTQVGLWCELPAFGAAPAANPAFLLNFA